MININFIKEPSTDICDEIEKKELYEDFFIDIEYNYKNLFRLCKINKSLFNYVSNFEIFKLLNEVNIDKLNIYSGFVKKKNKVLYYVNDKIFKKNNVNKLLLLCLIQFEPIFRNNFKNIDEFLKSNNYYVHGLTIKKYDIFYPYNEYYEYYYFFNIKNDVYRISYINLNCITISKKKFNINYSEFDFEFDLCSKNKDDYKYEFYKSLCEKIDIIPNE